MSQKGYRFSVGSWFSSEMERSNPALMLAAGTLFTVGGIVVRACVGSPYPMMRDLGISEIVPPAWLMALFSMLTFFTVGCGAGVVLGYRTGGCSSEKYRGMMFFFLLAAAELGWYPLFFSAGTVFLSVLLTILALSLAVITTASFFQTSKLAGLILMFHDLWLVYLLILNFAVLFRA